jgi:CBS domain-containing protein
MRAICAGDLMNPEVLTVPEEMSVSEVAKYLVEHEISGAPVVGAAGKLIGVVSLVDIVVAGSEDEEGEEIAGAGFYDQGWDDGEEEGPFQLDDLDEADWEELVVADIMTEAIYSVAEDASVSEVASTMLRHHVHRLVVTREEEVVGIISTSDLLGLLVDEG